MLSLEKFVPSLTKNRLKKPEKLQIIVGIDSLSFDISLKKNKETNRFRYLMIH